MKKLNDIVDKVYVINLDRRPDRMKKCADEMERYNIQYERFSAVDGKTLQDSKMQRKFDIACSLSHKLLLQDALNKGFEIICVFEDDVQLDVSFNRTFDIAFSDLPENWDLFYLGANNLITPTPITEKVHRIHRSLTTHAYLAHQRVFKKLIDLLERKNTINAVDNIFTLIQAENNSYIINPRIAYQKQGFSDIRQGFRNYDNVLK